MFRCVCAAKEIEIKSPTGGRVPAGGDKEEGKQKVGLQRDTKPYISLLH